MRPVDRAARLARSILIPVAVIAMTTSVAAQPRFRTPDVSAAIQRATAGLDVSSSQQADLDRIAARYADSEEPGVLWRVADEVRAVLTPAQIEQLQERPRMEGRRRDGERRIEQRRRRGGEHDGAGRGEHRMRRERHMEGEHRMEGEGRSRGERLHRMEQGIAEEHREAARALHERHREQIEELRSQRESGALEEDAFRERATALRQQMHRDIQPMLTEEARRMHEEMMELHERMEAVRDDVLRLTPDQRAAFGERFHRRRAGGEGALDALSAEQRATLAVYHALMRGAHRSHDVRRLHLER